ncbi:MAG: PKD domain-containing protein [Patescibacteria group bacterium]
MRILLFIIFLFNPLNALAAAPSIVITEIAASLPQDQEWLEIFNTGENPINISEWRLTEGFTESQPQGSRHKFTAYQGDLIIEPKEYAIIANEAESFIKKYPSFTWTLIDSSWSSLKESGELLRLIDDQGAVIEEFTYISAPDGVLQRIDPYALNYAKDNWIEIIGGGSPGQANQNNQLPPLADNNQTGDNPIIENEPEKQTLETDNDLADNLPPQAIIAGENLTVLINQEIMFDGSQSFDPEGAELTYFWDFNDGEKARGQSEVAHQFVKEGDYYARLRVSDGELKDDDKIKITVLEQEEDKAAAPANSNYADVSDSPKNLQPETGNGFQGIVMIEPGIFAKTYFYLSSPDGKNCAQIYSSKSEFPDLYIGQLVEVRGSTSKYYDINRIKILRASDISIIKGQDPPLPRKIDLSRISDDYLGCLISVSGQILKEQGMILITDASGNSQLRLGIKAETGVQKTDLKEGGAYKIAGILDKTKSGLRLLPRHKTDIEDASATMEQEPKLDSHAQILGEKVNIDFADAGYEIKLESNQDKKREILKYLLAAGAALLIILIGMQVKKWRKN